MKKKSFIKHYLSPKNLFTYCFRLSTSLSAVLPFISIITVNNRNKRKFPSLAVKNTKIASKVKKITGIDPKKIIVYTNDFLPKNIRHFAF